MCEAIRQIREEGWKEGWKEGIEQNKHDVAVNALQMKLCIKTIQRLTGLTADNIRNIAQSIAML